MAYLTETYGDAMITKCACIVMTQCCGENSVKRDYQMAGSFNAETQVQVPCKGVISEPSRD